MGATCSTPVRDRSVQPAGGDIESLCRKGGVSGGFAQVGLCWEQLLKLFVERCDITFFVGTNLKGGF